MIKHELIREAARRTGYTQEMAAEIIEAAIRVTTDALEAGDSLLIRGFGKFEVKQRRGRTMKDLRTGEQIEIPAKTTIAFVASEKLKNRVNEGK